MKWGKVCWDAERWGESTHSFTPLPTPSTLTRHFFPHSPNTSPPHHLTRLFTLSHTHLPTLSHTSPHPSHFSSPPPTLTSPDTFPSTTPTLPHTYSPYFLTNPTPPPTLPHTPHTLSFTPYQNFLLFSFIAQLVWSNNKVF